MSRQVVQGPGSLRVGQYIGRLGVVSLPAIQAGLDLDQRVVRRHVAKLEKAGWLARAPWVWGEGSVVWLTGAGMERAGLGGVRAVKAPPAPTTISHGVLIGSTSGREGRVALVAIAFVIGLSYQRFIEKAGAPALPASPHLGLYSSIRRVARTRIAARPSTPGSEPTRGVARALSGAGLIGPRVPLPGTQFKPTCRRTAFGVTVPWRQW